MFCLLYISCQFGGNVIAQEAAGKREIHLFNIYKKWRSLFCDIIRRKVTGESTLYSMITDYEMILETNVCVSIDTIFILFGIVICSSLIFKEVLPSWITLRSLALKPTNVNHLMLERAPLFGAGWVDTRAGRWLSPKPWLRLSLWALFKGAHPGRHFGVKMYMKELTPKMSEMVDSHCAEVCSASCKGSSVTSVDLLTAWNCHYFDHVGACVNHDTMQNK